MLTQLRTRPALVFLAALCALIAMQIFVASPARADQCWIDQWGHQTCDITVGQPSDPGTGSGGTSPVGFIPGPSKCVWNGVPDDPDPNRQTHEIPCSTGDNWWSNSAQCYWSIDNPQRQPPIGQSANVGAYYSCDPYQPDAAFCNDVKYASWNCYGVSVWRNAPPPGINRYTPAQAAGMLVRTFVLEPIPIGMAPESKVHSDDPVGTAAYRRTWVGIPVWLWVDNTSASTWGPLSKSATYGGVTVSATAQVQSLTWNSGDGQVLNCGVGTRFNEQAMADQLAVDSPTCGFRYQHTSGSGTFTVSASTSWVVRWSGGGETGTIAMPSTTSTAQVHVGELQSVNTANYGG